ncbi:MAG: GNAT family N-acetyltransferase, partial [Bacteroidales bacterium]|nr:GNAT family N-acetyltransferase [Bacteroidales bacterium]MDD3490231.1 GNAT family N-acetyltransferase [Paludibacter sp.]
METLTLQTARLTIRHLELSDLRDFFVYRSNPEVTKYQGFDVMTMEQAEEFIADNSTKRFGKAGEWVQYGIEKNETKVSAPRTPYLAIAAIALLLPEKIQMKNQNKNMYPHVEAWKQSG